MDQVQKETFLDQSVSTALSKIQRWVPCSIDTFFNSSTEQQLTTLKVLQTWATNTAVFRDIRFRFLGTREELDRSHAITALGANNLRLNYYPYNPHFDNHVERISPYIAQNLLEEHHSVDAFMEHS